jgi:hypothetical protein
MPFLIILLVCKVLVIHHQHISGKENLVLSDVVDSLLAFQECMPLVLQRLI